VESIEFFKKPNGQKINTLFLKMMIAVFPTNSRLRVIKTDLKNTLPWICDFAIYSKIELTSVSPFDRAARKASFCKSFVCFKASLKYENPEFSITLTFASFTTKYIVIVYSNSHGESN